MPAWHLCKRSWRPTPRHQRVSANGASTATSPAQPRAHAKRRLARPQQVAEVRSCMHQVLPRREANRTGSIDEGRALRAGLAAMNLQSPAATLQAQDVRLGRRIATRCSVGARTAKGGTPRRLPRTLLTSSAGPRLRQAEPRPRPVPLAPLCPSAYLDPLTHQSRCFTTPTPERGRSVSTEISNELPRVVDPRSHVNPLRENSCQRQRFCSRGLNSRSDCGPSQESVSTLERGLIELTGQASGHRG